jgi:hypothetical protein
MSIEFKIQHIEPDTPCPKCGNPMPMPSTGQLLFGNPCYFCYTQEEEDNNPYKQKLEEIRKAIIQQPPLDAIKSISYILEEKE